MTIERKRAKAELYLFLITFVWGSTFIVTKDLLSEITPFAYVGVRFSIAALLFGLVSFRALGRWRKETMWRGGVLGFLLFAGFALQTFGLQTTSASKSAFITGMLVVFTPLWQVALERRLPRPGSILGVLLVTIGLYFLTSPSGGGFVLGDALTLGAAALFGLYIVYLDMFGKDDETAKLTMAQFVVAGGMGAVFAVSYESTDISLTPSAMAELGYLIIFATIVALYVQTRYQKDSTPTRSAVIFSLEPVIAAGFAYTVAGEILGLSGWLGGAIILTGLLLSEFSDTLFPGLSRWWPKEP